MPEHLSVISSTRALSEPAQWQGNDRVAGGQMSRWEEHKVGSRMLGLHFQAPSHPEEDFFVRRMVPATTRESSYPRSQERGGSWSNPGINVKESFTDLVWEPGTREMLIR